MEFCLNSVELGFFLDYLNEDTLTFDLEGGRVLIETATGLVEWLWIEWAGIWSFGGDLSCTGGYAV